MSNFIFIKINVDKIPIFMPQISKNVEIEYHSVHKATEPGN